MDILDELVFRETVRDALRLMTGYELLLAAGRAAGMSDQELAERMDIDPSAVSYHLGQARRRIVEHIPELRVTLSGRRRPRHTGEAPEQDEACSLEQAAERLGVAVETVALWIQQAGADSAYRLGNEWRVVVKDWQDGSIAGAEAVSSQ